MATLQITCSERIILDGKQHGKVNNYAIAGIQDVYNRSFTIKQGTESTLYTTSTDGGGGADFDKQGVKYVRITNNGKEPVLITVMSASGGSADEYVYEITRGQSHYLFSHDLALLAHNTDITDKTTLLGIEKVTAECKRGRGVIDVFIASAGNNYYTNR